MLRNVDARYFALTDSNGTLSPHLTGSATLAGGALRLRACATSGEIARPSRTSTMTDF